MKNSQNKSFFYYWKQTVKEMKFYISNMVTGVIPMKEGMKWLFSLEEDFEKNKPIVKKERLKPRGKNAQLVSTKNKKKKRKTGR